MRSPVLTLGIALPGLARRSQYYAGTLRYAPTRAIQHAPYYLQIARGGSLTRSSTLLITDFLPSRYPAPPNLVPKSGAEYRADCELRLIPARSGLRFERHSGARDAGLQFRIRGCHAQCQPFWQRSPFSCSPCWSAPSERQFSPSARGERDFP
eukprot:931997-Rhodomonas_salina.1